MSFGAVSRGEWIAMLGGALLAVAAFVKCYEARPENPNATLETGEDGVCVDRPGSPSGDIELEIAGTA